MHKNITLVVDSTTSPLLLAFEYKGRVYSAKKAGVKQEELLFPALNKILTKAGLTLSDVKKVFFLRGPGRFTGIRISITLAGMLRALNGAEACSMTVFEFLHYQAERRGKFGGIHAVVLHAFREEYFLQVFDGSAPVWLSKEELLARIKSYAGPLAISGFDKDRGSLKELLKGFNVLDDKYSIISPKFLCAAAAETRFAKDTLEPLYLKPARFELGR